MSALDALQSVAIDKTEDEDTRVVAAQALVAIGSSQAVGTLKQLLGDNFLEYAVIRGLTCIGMCEAIQALIGVLGRTSPATDTIEKALLGLGADKVIEPLIAALGHPSQVVRDRADVLVEKLNIPLPRLLAAISDIKPEVRQRAGVIFAQRCDSDISILEKAMDDFIAQDHTQASTDLTSLEQAVEYLDRAISMGQAAPVLCGLAARAAFESMAHLVIMNEHPPVERVIHLLQVFMKLAKDYLQVRSNDEWVSKRYQTSQQIVERTEAPTLAGIEEAVAYRISGQVQFDTWKDLGLYEDVNLPPDWDEEQPSVWGTEIKIRNVIRAYKQALRLKPDYIDARCMLAETYEGLKLYPKAIDVLEEGVRLSPVSWRLYAGLAEVQRDTQQYALALKNYEMAASLNPLRAVLYNCMGIMNQELGNEQAAFECFQRAVKADPNDPQIRGGLLVGYMHRKDLEGAAREAMKVLPSSRECVHDYAYFVANEGSDQIKVLGEQHRIREGLKLLNTIMAPFDSIDRSHPEAKLVAHAYQGVAYSTQIMRNEDRSIQAIDATIPLLQCAIQLDSAEPEYRNFLAILLSNKGRFLAVDGKWNEALTSMKQSVDTDPTWAAYHYPQEVKGE